MKKKLLLFSSLILILVLTACGSAASATGASDQTQTAESGTTQLPTISKLVGGTYKLIDSATPITQTQASEMVILWKAYQELNTRDATATQEVSDLLTQINSEFTSEQAATVEAMNLTSQDIMTIAKELGVNEATGSERSSSQSSATSNSGQGGFPAGGNPPDGGGPGGGGGPGVGGDFGQGSNTSSTPSASTRATMQAARSNSGAQVTNLSILLIDPLIVRLEAIANPG